MIEPSKIHQEPVYVYVWHGTILKLVVYLHGKYVQFVRLMQYNTNIKYHQPLSTKAHYFFGQCTAVHTKGSVGGVRHV